MKASGLPPNPPGTPTCRQRHALTTPRTSVAQSPHKHTRSGMRQPRTPFTFTLRSRGWPQHPRRGAVIKSGPPEVSIVPPLAKAEVVPRCSPEDVEVWYGRTGRRQRLEPGRTPPPTPPTGPTFQLTYQTLPGHPSVSPRLNSSLHLHPVTPATRTCKSVSDKAFPSRRN